MDAVSGFLYSFLSFSPGGIPRAGVTRPVAPSSRGRLGLCGSKGVDGSGLSPVIEKN